VNNDDILVAGAARRSCGRGEDHEQMAKRKCHLLLLLDEFRACFGDFLWSVDRHRPNAVA